MRYLRIPTALQRRAGEDVTANWIGLSGTDGFLHRLVVHVLVEDDTFVTRPTVHVEMESGVQQRA